MQQVISIAMCERNQARILNLTLIEWEFNDENEEKDEHASRFVACLVEKKLSSYS